MGVVGKTSLRQPLGRGVIKGGGGWKSMWGENSSEAEQVQWP